MKKYFWLMLLFFGLVLLSSCSIEKTKEPEETKELEKLKTPVVTIDNNGLASWDEIKHAEGYAYKINDGKAVETDELEVQLSDGDSIRVKALGDGEEYRDSSYSKERVYVAEEETPVFYTIIFDANGGTGFMESQVFSEYDLNNSNLLELRENEFVKEGYVFAGWTIQDSDYYTRFTDTIDKKYFKETNVITLSAVWEEASILIKLWVESESLMAYEKVVQDYYAYYVKKYQRSFPGEIRLVGVDVGSAANTLIMDPNYAGDIIAIPHDQLGNLLQTPGLISPIYEYSLLEQMEANNPQAFLDVCYLNDAYYAVPYASQSLVLYYNKNVFAGQEDKLASWEGILEVAKANNALATSFSGSDGYNYSSFLLAQPYNEKAKSVFGNKGTLQIYSDGIRENCMGYGDDQVAIHKYAQRFIQNPNGRNREITSTYGWSTELENGKAITFIGGSWHENTVNAILGYGNYGIVELPTFTLTEADAYGSATAGMTFHSGSYVDAKCFVKNGHSNYDEYLDDILKYITSDSVQQKVYEEAGIQPASKNVKLGENPLANAQQAQANYGIAQPFGYNNRYNTYYYSKGAPDIYAAIHQNKNGMYNTNDAILRGLQEISYIWVKGKNPTTEQELIDWVNNRYSDFPTPEPEPVSQDSYHVVGGYYGDWSDYTNDNMMTEISIYDLPLEVREALLNKEVSGVYKLEYRFFGERNEWTSTAYINGEVVYVDGGYTLKIVKARYDSLDDVTYALQWNPDPKTSHVQNLTPNSLFIPKWVETPAYGEEHLGNWSENPVVISGEGEYIIYFVEYKGLNSFESPKYAMAAVKLIDDNLGIEVLNDSFENMLNGAVELPLGEGDKMVNNYGSGTWDSYVSVVRDPLNNENTVIRFEYSVEGKVFSSFYKFLELKPNARYMIEFDYLVIGETDNFGMRFAGSPMLEKTFYSGGTTNGWQHASWEWTTSTDSYYDSIGMWFNTNGSVAHIGYIDNIRIVLLEENVIETPEQNSPSIPELGEGDIRLSEELIDGYGSGSWDSYAIITKDPLNSENTVFKFSYTVDGKVFSSFYKFLELRPNARYMIEFDYLVIGETDNFGMRFAGSPMLEKTFYIGGSTNGWQHIEWEWTTSIDANYDSIGVWFNTNGSINNFGYIDNIVITLIEENVFETPEVSVPKNPVDGELPFSDPAFGETYGPAAGWGSGNWDSHVTAMIDPNNSSNTIIRFDYSDEGKAWSSLFKFCNILPNTTYVISLDYKVEGETDNFGIRFAGSPVLEKVFYSGGATDGWQHFEWEWTTSTEAWYDSIGMWFNTASNSNNKGYIDNIVIKIKGTEENIINGGDFEGFLDQINSNNN